LSTWPPKGKHWRFHIDPPVQKHVDALVARQIGDKAGDSDPKFTARARSGYCAAQAGFDSLILIVGDVALKKAGGVEQ
jgi:hypothetical protein